MKRMNTTVLLWIVFALACLAAIVCPILAAQGRVTAHFMEWSNGQKALAALPLILIASHHRVRRVLRNVGLLALYVLIQYTQNIYFKIIKKA